MLENNPLTVQLEAKAKFVSGSTLKHVMSMTASGTAGLIAVYAVDLLNLFYISLLGQKELAAAVGYAATLLFFVLSLCIGLCIGVGALTSRALGRGDRDYAKRLSGASLMWMVISMAVAVALTYPFLRQLLGVLGATGATADLALRFCRVVLPSAPLLGAGMCLGSLLRALGDGKRAMYITLGTGLTTALLDPILIFGFGWGLDGAAIATVLARFVMVATGLHGLLRVHKLFAWPDMSTFRETFKPFFAIGLPSVLTQIATPISNSFVTAAIAPYGDDAVGGWAVVGRIIPVSFAALFALSGAVGPIIGQNLGAKRYDRLQSTMSDALKFVVIYVMTVWLCLALFSTHIADVFGAAGQGREVIVFFCTFIAGGYVFNGAVFVANAAFNNLGYVMYSTVLNWGRATLGVLPFIWLGGHYYGLKGVLIGYGLGAIFFGVAAVWLCFKVLGQMKRRASLGN